MNGLFGKRTHKRRPEGVSRKRRKQYSFEALEDRRYMTATPNVPIAPLVTPGQVLTASSSSTDGQLAVLARELYWQQLMAGDGAQPDAVVNSAFAPNDPLFGDQWHLLNVGQQVGNPDFQPIYGVPGEDINVMPAWAMGYTGAGVKVAVIDSGVQLDHPDLAPNIDLGLSFDALNPSGTGNPYFFNPLNAHGTAVAGLIAAVGNNGIGGTGVAPGATIVPIRLIDTGQTPQAFVDAFRHTIGNVDITNNSWGSAAPRFLAGPDEQTFLALRDSILFGRGGKGVIHVFSAGNNGGPQFSNGFSSIGGYDSSSYSGYLNSRYTIGVTGVDHDGFYNNADGTITVYPETGADILVAAPTGSNAGPVITNDTGLGSGLWTTDLTGDFGFNASPDPITGQETQDPFYPADRDFESDPDYTSRMNGTSAAAPLVSGVVALMLQANPNLTWRDVQEILLRSARQNAPLGVPNAGGTSGVVTQNTWIVNQLPIFHDPDLYNPTVRQDPSLMVMNPVMDPNQVNTVNGLDPLGATSDHYVPDPFTMTTGAGYTVSQGTGFYGEQVGYAHGVVDAEMAVKLAQQWTTKDQTLAPELTFSTYVQGATPDLPQARFALPAAQQSSLETGRMIVPGGIGGLGPFIQTWEEYFAADPDFGALPPQYRGDSAMEFNVPVDQNMRVENVEVKLSLTGGSAADVMDHVRILLISPEGTHSELNNFWVPDQRPYTFQLNANPNLPFDQQLTRAVVVGEPGSLGSPDGNFVWTFKTNRSWGERANDAIVFDPSTGEPVIDQNGIFSGPNAVAGQAMTQGWRLVLENYNTDTSFSIGGVEIAFHGAPIAANTQRILGFVGVDDNQDDAFNYSRMIRQDINIDNDPSTLRLGELQAIPDPNQESFAGDVTVTARRTSDNSIAAQFVTGHDGNFYFDLVPDDYIISIEDAAGRAAKDDTTTASGLLRHYEKQWHITPDWFKVWDHSALNPSEVLVDANGQPIPWLDGNGQSVTYGMKQINFLLDPGDVPAQQAVFTGTIYADSNGDGAFNSSDVILPGTNVFADANRNGQYDSGEIVAAADANGAYNLVVPVTQTTVMNVGVIPPASWTVTNPVGKSYSVFVKPGSSTSDLNFFLKPAANNIGGGGATDPGILMGSIFIDVNGNQVRDSLEQGAAGVTVYIDDNNNGVAEVTERKTTANQFGAFAFTNVEPGQHVIRLVTEGTFAQTLPAAGGAQVVNLAGSSVISGITFGIRDAAIYDYGDLPAKYNATLLADNGARHLRGPYWLGSRIDGELDGAPSDTANSDDNNQTQNDEDGVAPIVFTSGANASLTVTASRYNGYLQGWIDWNDDGDFNDAGERVITNRLLDAGANHVDITVPAGVTASQVYARFRYGEFGINSVTGAALTGEVEDYVFSVIPAASPVVGIGSDFNHDGKVDGADFLAWQRNAGRTAGSTQTMGNADGDSDVDKFDLDIWQQEYGVAASGAALMAEEDASDPFASLLTGGSSAPLGIVSAGLAASETGSRPAYRPAMPTLLTDPALFANTVSTANVETARTDDAIDSLFGSRDWSKLNGDSSTADGDEAFALLGSGVI
jgi:subtilisin family serine protease